MPASVVDQIFARREAVDPTDARVKQGGPLDPNVRGRGVQKASRPPRRNFPASMMEITAKIKMEKAVTALSTIELCKKRQGELAAQLMPLPAMGPAYRSLGSDNAPRRDPDEKAVYDEERGRLAAILRAAQDELDRLFGTEVGPPLDLQAAVQQRKARSAQQALEAQMADMAMGDAPESPAPSFASTDNPRFLRDQQAQQNRSDSPPPAFRSIGTDD